MKKITISLAVLALSLFVATPVLAQDAVSVDFNGGLVLNDNLGSVCDFTSASANSGYNVGDEEATVATHSSSAVTLTSTDLNSSETTGSITDTASGPIAVNNDVDEEALALAIDANVAGVINFNDGMVSNKSFALSNSGFNTAGEESAILAGTAGSTTSTDTDLNSNMTDVTIDNNSHNGPVAFNEDVDEDGTAVAVNVNGALVMNTNLGGVCNFSVAGANSGVNVIDEEGNVTTATATAATGATTDLNANDTTIAIRNSDSPVAANTDVDDEGLAISADANFALVDNSNYGEVTNFSMAGANTGANYGGEESSISTGVAVAETSAITTVNTNKTVVTIADNTNGPVAVNTDDKHVNPCNPQIPNPCIEDGCPCDEISCGDSLAEGRGTGPVAANIDTDGGVAIAVNANVAVVGNDNEGSVLNVSTAVANSGANGAGEESTVSTGAALASTGATSNVNSNDTTVGITDGASSGPVAANVDTDGGTAVAVDANVAAVSNNNEATVTNVSNASANTGANGDPQSASCTSGCEDNAEGGSVTTGAASASTRTTTEVNSNTTTFTINH